MKVQKINLLDIVDALSDILDMVSPVLRNHQNNVGYISLLIAKEMNLCVKDQNEILIAGLLHDIGATSLKERLSLLNFEIENPHIHAERGYKLLKRFKYFKKVSEIIRFHHFNYDFGKGLEFEGKEIPIGSHILNLSDRFEVLLNKNENPLKQKEDILKKIKEYKGKLFHPDIVDIFFSIADKEYFWIDIFSFKTDEIIPKRTKLIIIEVDMYEFSQFSKIVSRIIDFRDRFTFFHSTGVSIIAKEIAKSIGFSEFECNMMEIAGLLHDVGKLAIPIEIIQKKEKLNEDEMNIIKTHSYYTFRTFEEIEELNEINLWASLHHEKLDGTGYPFHLKEKDIPLGSRIMTISDIFNALTEDRPYRKGMDIKTSLKILNDMAKDKKIDPFLLSTLEKNIDEINEKRLYVQTLISNEFKGFNAQMP
jgi:HD-GYP domain-containing protein (c-di-GMP phosphodiesterase class II)